MESEPPALSDFEVIFSVSEGVTRREPLAMCWSTRFESVEPIRTFSSYRGRRGFPGWWWWVTTKRHVGFESWLERDHVMMLDFDSKVIGLSSQPFWLVWPGSPRSRRHAPDFFARLDDGTGVVIDVRADDQIEAEDARVFTTTARACQAVGWHYRRVGALDPVTVTNVRWLSGYRHPRCLGQGWVSPLREAFKTPRPFLDGVQEVGDPIAVLPTAFHLVWSTVLVCDLRSAPLTAETLMSTAGVGG